jgi:chromosome segregation ATPase
MSLLDVLMFPVHRKLNGIIERLDAITVQLKRDHTQGERLMTKLDDVKALAERIDQATNDEAAQLEAQTAVLDSVQAEIDSLKAQMATDPANPVPEPAPPVA